MGEDGGKLINEGVVEQAIKLGLADAKVVVADLTAQEAAIPHPKRPAARSVAMMGVCGQRRGAIAHRIALAASRQPAATRWQTSRNNWRDEPLILSS